MTKLVLSMVPSGLYPPYAYPAPALLWNLTRAHPRGPPNFGATLQTLLPRLGLPPFHFSSPLPSLFLSLSLPPAFPSINFPFPSLRPSYFYSWAPPPFAQPQINLSLFFPLSLFFAQTQKSAAFWKSGLLSPLKRYFKKGRTHWLLFLFKAVDPELFWPTAPLVPHPPVSPMLTL